MLDGATITQKRSILENGPFLSDRQFKKVTSSPADKKYGSTLPTN